MNKEKIQSTKIYIQILDKVISGLNEQKHKLEKELTEPQPETPPEQASKSVPVEDLKPDDERVPNEAEVEETKVAYNERTQKLIQAFLEKFKSFDEKALNTLCCVVTGKRLRELSDEEDYQKMLKVYHSNKESLLPKSN